MGVWVCSVLLAISTALDFWQTTIDFSKPVHNPVQYLTLKQEMFLAERIEEFNRRHNVEMTVAFLNDMGKFSKLSEISRSLFESDYREYGKDRRIILMFYANSPDGNRWKLRTFMEAGDSFREELPIPLLQSLNKSALREFGDGRPFEASRKAAAEIFSKIDPHSSSDVATANLANIRYGRFDVFMYKATTTTRVMLVLVVLVGAIYFVHQLRIRWWEGFSPKQPGALTRKQMFSRRII